VAILVQQDTRTIYAAARAGDVRHSLADITLAKKLIGFKPVVSFKDGLERAIDWYRKNLV